MLSTRDSFKVGFLSRCVEEGIAPEDIGAVIEKTSAALDKVLEKQGHVVKDANLLDSLTKVPGALLDIAGRVAGPVIGAATSYGIPLALLAPPLAGGVAGYGLARMGDVSDEDVEAIRVKESGGQGGERQSCKGIPEETTEHRSHFPLTRGVRI